MSEPKRYKEMWEDAFHENLENKAKISELKAEVERLNEEVTYQKQKAQDMVEFICECVAKGEFKAFKNGSVKFGKTTKGVKS